MLYLLIITMTADKGGKVCWVLSGKDTALPPPLVTIQCALQCCSPPPSQTAACASGCPSATQGSQPCLQLPLAGRGKVGWVLKGKATALAPCRCSVMCPAAPPPSPSLRAAVPVHITSEP